MIFSIDYRYLKLSKLILTKINDLGSLALNSSFTVYKHT